MRALMILLLAIPLMGAQINFKLSSAAFSNGTSIPQRYTCDGENISPPLAWSGPPQGTRSFALIVEDPDAPGGTYRHWGLYNIKAGTDHLGEGIAPANAYRETHNDFGNLGYGGPCPPSGQGVHHYHFRLLALDIAELNLPEHVPVESVEKAVQPHILSTAEIVALYGR